MTSNTLSHFPKWLDEVKRLSGDRFGFFEVVYPFRRAFDNEMTPQQAFDDCAAQTSHE